MRFYYGSDFHIDFWSNQDMKNPFSKLDIDPKEFEAFILAGDIGEWSERYVKFIEVFANTKKPVFVVLGNHEYYHGEFPNTAFDIQEGLENRFSNVHVLLDNYIDIQEKGIRVFGTTLWTDYNRGNPAVLVRARTDMNDFQYIMGAEPRRFSSAHARSLEHLETAFKGKPDGYKFLAVSHHAPSLKACEIHHERRGTPSHLVDYCFGSRLGQWFDSKGLYPDIWVHGHTHISASYLICQGKIPVVCNSFGYQGKSDGEDTGYRPKFFEL